jgi:two-component system chemotaxis response regulator CheB
MPTEAVTKSSVTGGEAVGEIRRRRTELVVIGASAGALEALSTILPVLPEDYRPSVAIVVHLTPSGPSLLAELLGRRCALPVREAVDKEPLEGGTIFVAAPDYHLLVERERSLALSVDGPVNYSRPSIDVLFESAADAYGASVAGVVLTGASEDGARGLLCIRIAGGCSIVQDPATAEIPFMPTRAIEIAKPDYVLPLSSIGAFLAELGQETTSNRGT